MAARSALLKYLRVNARIVPQNPSPFTVPFNVLLRRHFSEEARGSFLDKSEVADRVITVVKNFQKVDPSKLLTETLKPVIPHNSDHLTVAVDQL